MRLLIVTQVVDSEDLPLGFFTRWITEFARHAEHVEVICLKEGKHDLPPNVRVHSLGKEKGAVNRLVYSWRFLCYAWKLRGEYDAVFVHMNQEYILIAGWLWKLLGKPIYMWRNHFAGSWLTDTAAFFCTKVFCTSRYSYTAKYARTLLMPVGIDTEVFHPREARKAHSILFLARMAPSKRPDLLIEALGILHAKGVTFTADLYGSPLPADEDFYQSLKGRVKELGLDSQVHFYPGPRGAENQSLYPAYEICVNASPSGMYDKTIFESAACEGLSLTSNQNLAGQVDARLLFKEADALDLAEKLEGLLTLKAEEKKSLQEQMHSLALEHSLTRLGSELMLALSSPEAVIFQNGSIGDFLMYLHLSEALLTSQKYARVTIVVSRNAVLLRKIAAGYPKVRVYEISSKNWSSLTRLWIGRKTVLVSPTIGKIPLSVKLLVWLLIRGEGSRSIGFQDAGPLCNWYTQMLQYDTTKLYLEALGDLARAAGIALPSEPPRLRFTTPSQALAKLGLEAKRYIVFHPGASNPKRMFSVDAAVETIRSILSIFPEEAVVVSGGPEERAFVEEIVRAVANTKVMSAAGVSIEDVVVLVRSAALFIGTDTGITHLACFLGTRVLEVAHNATANWLAFYAPNATVLYQLAKDKEAHTGYAYLKEHARGELRPFTTVPIEAIENELRSLAPRS
jgi:ADP-heptose:LPS heptosyltransferase/glycosyltransferase involved in cell wall biosynthesis